MSEINTPLLRKVLDHITAHPEEWDQETWGRRTACGTSHCIAGHAVVMSGADLLWIKDEALALSLPGSASSTTSVEDEAAELFGLSCSNADNLFDCDNDLRRIYTLANEYTGGEIAIPDELPDGS